MSPISKEASGRRINTLKTVAETGWNITKAAALPVALGYLGINSFDLSSAAIHEIWNKASQGPVPFLGGVVVGWLKNEVLINRTLKNLQGKTSQGTEKPLYKETDGTRVAKITCVDARRFSKSGGAIPGSFAVLGSEITSVLSAAAISAMTPDANPVAQFATGYIVGSNISTELRSHIGLFSQIDKIVRHARVEDPHARVKILMEDHWDGCGAQGFTNIASYLAKFKLHNLKLADFLGLPNEVLGYLYVNSVISPLVAARYGGQVSLTASLRHTPMHK